MTITPEMLEEIKAACEKVPRLILTARSDGGVQLGNAEGGYLAAHQLDAIRCLIVFVPALVAEVERLHVVIKKQSESVKRYNAMSCCCQFSEDEEGIKEMCSLHAAIIRPLERENAELRDAISQFFSQAIAFKPEMLTDEQNLKNEELTKRIFALLGDKP